jgi:hypothetical protein
MVRPLEGGNTPVIIEGWYEMRHRTREEGIGASYWIFRGGRFASQELCVTAVSFFRGVVQAMPNPPIAWLSLEPNFSVSTPRCCSVWTQRLQSGGGLLGSWAM